MNESQILEGLQEELEQQKKLIEQRDTRINQLIEAE